MYRVGSILAAVVFALGLASLGAVFYVVGGAEFRPDPVDCEMRGRHFEVRCADGVPYLLVDGLPFPTHFESVDHPVQSLSGRGRLRRDPSDAGAEAGWYREGAGGEGWRDVGVPSPLASDVDGRVVWYALRFRASDAPSPEHFPRISFDGVALRSRVWLNGEPLGLHTGGYTPFLLDASGSLRPGAENLLVVRVDARPTRASLPPKLSERQTPAWATHGAIHRDVRLEWLPPQYVFKARAHTRRDETGATQLVVRVLTRLRGIGPPFRLLLRVLDPDGRSLADTWISDAGSTSRDRVALHEFTFDVRRPRPYRPETPDLYRVEIRVETSDASHGVAVLSGLRDVAVSAGRLLIDGQPVRLLGTAIDRDGAAPPEALHDAIDRARDLGANFARLVDHPRAPALLGHARDRGLWLWEQIPFHQVGTGLLREDDGFPISTFGLRQLTDPELLDAAAQQLIEMIERDANNPAIVIWSVGDGSYSYGESAGRVHGWLADIARFFDGTRPVTSAELTTGYDWLDDRRRASAHVDVVSVDLDASFGTLADVGRHIDRLHEHFPDKPMLVSGSFPELARVAREREFVAGVIPLVDSTRGSLEPAHADSPVAEPAP